MRYAQALADWADAGGYEAEALWDVLHRGRARRPATTRRQYRDGHAPCPAASRSGWCSRRCCAGRTRCCCSTSRTTTSTCPASSWLEEQLRETRKTVLLVSHDRELLARAATRIVTVEPGAAGDTAWMHGGGFATYHAGRQRPVRAARGAAPALGRGARQAQGAGAACTRSRPRTTTAWPSRYQAAQTRLRKFEEAGPPQEIAARADRSRCGSSGGRTGKRAVSASGSS